MVKNKELEANKIALRTKFAYSFDNFADGEWEKSALMLLNKGYNSEEVEAVLRSKWTRWCQDSFCSEEQKAEAHMLEKFVDNINSNTRKDQVKVLLELSKKQ